MAAYTAVDNSEAHFQVKLWTGNGTAIGSGGNSITFDGETDMAPGMLWYKRRDATAGHNMHDEVRGAQKRVYPDVSDVEDTGVTEGVNAFTSDGFNLGNSGAGNASGGTYVAWCWKANGSGSANSDGNTTTTKTSANTTSGFSIITYDGDGGVATLGHGLGAKPEFIIQKNRDDTEHFQIQHGAKGATHYGTLNTSNTIDDLASRWNDTEPTSTLITIGTDSSVSQSGESMVMYAWAGVQGFSKFGSYTGNVNADGVYIYLGFKPALLIIKETGNAEPWIMYDNKRSDSGGPNPNDQHLTADGNGAASSGTVVDFLSTGVKLRSNAGHLNEGSYIYMAWAEAPFVNSNGVPCNAK